MAYCCHFWGGAPSFYLDMLKKLQRQVCRTIGPILVASLELLGHCKNIAGLNLLYRYYFGRFLSELAELSLSSYSFERSTHYYDGLLDFSVTIPRCYKDAYANSFLAQLDKNSVPAEFFPLTYDLSSFKPFIFKFFLNNFLVCF